jgi:mannosyltransferase
LTVAVAVGGFLHLTSRSIWGDEAISISYARRSPTGLHDSILADPNMSLYYALLWAWTHLVGDRLAAIKIPSVASAALTVPVVYALGARLFGQRAGLAAALLLSVNAYFLTFAQEARGYSLVTLLTALSFYLFVRALDHPTPGRLTAYAVVSALAFYAHFFAVYVTLIQVAALVIVRGRRAFCRRWLAVYAGVGAMVAPICYQALRVEPDPIGWVPPPGWRTLGEIARDLAGTGVLLTFASLALVAGALSQLARTEHRRFAVALTAAWLVVPTATAFLVSQVHPMLLPRYVVISVPALALLVGAAVAEVRPKRLGAACLAVLVALSAYPLWRWYERPALEDWKSTSAFVLARARDGDGVAFQRSSTVPAFAYYERHSRERPALDWGHRRLVIPPHASRIWLVLYQSGTEAQELRARLRRRDLHRVVRGDFHGNIRVELFASRDQ